MQVLFRSELTETERSEWTGFWTHCKFTHAEQHLMWAGIERGKGRIPVFVSGHIDDTVVCIGLFSVRPLVRDHYSLEAVCLRGPVCDRIDAFEEYITKILAEFRERGVGSVRISPYWHSPEATSMAACLQRLGFRPYYRKEKSFTETGRVDLKPEINEIAAAFSKYTRRDIKRIEAFGIELRAITNLDDAILAYRSLCRMREQRGLTPMSRSEFVAAFEAVLKEGELGILFGAFFHEDFLGALWLKRGPVVANTAGYAIEREDCKRISNGLTIGPALWWEGIKWAKEKGCAWLDVEGYSEETPESSPVYDVHQFKRKFRPIPVQIMSEHVLICNKAVYFLYLVQVILRRALMFQREVAYRLSSKFARWIAVQKSRKVLAFQRQGNKL